MSEQKIIDFDFSPEILKPCRFCVNRKQEGYEAIHDITHLFYLYFIVKGSGNIRTKQSCQAFQTGDILYVFPGNQCEISFLSEENEWVWISVEIGNNVEFCYWNQIKHGVLLLPGGIRKDVMETLLSLEKETWKGRERPFRILGFLYTMFDEIVKNTSGVPAEKLTGMKDSRSVLKAVEYIDLNYYHKMDIDSICSYVNYSRYYFSRRFKEIQGMSITEYINKVRLDRAIYLLSHTDLTVIQVARSVGFDDPYYFSKKFKTYTGMAPGRFKSTYQ